MRPHVCSKCHSLIKEIHQPACQKCCQPLEAAEQEYCYDCGRKEHYFERGVAGFEYSSTMKQSMYSFKYNNRREYAKYYAGVIVKNWKRVIKTWNAEALVPIPISKSRYRKRGYNQAEILAIELARLLNIPVASDVIKRIKNTLPQKNLDDKTRYLNLNNAFQIANSVVEYKSVILVDDIYTTGATMDSCSRTLKDNGVKWVYFISACVGRGF